MKEIARLMLFVLATTSTYLAARYMQPNWNTYFWFLGTIIYFLLIYDETAKSIVKSIKETNKDF